MAEVQNRAGELPYPNDAARSWSIRSSGAMLRADRKLSCACTPGSQTPIPHYLPSTSSRPPVFSPTSHTEDASKYSQVDLIL